MLAPFSIHSFLKVATPEAPPAPATLAPTRRPAVEATPAPSGLPKHIPALDGLRGVAVLLVLFCHATLRPFDSLGPDGTNAAFSGVLDKLILAAARLSWTGVDLFFVPSGFLITGIL